MSFNVGNNRPAIIVARAPVTQTQYRTLAQIRADDAAARSGRRQASYAANRLVAIPRGIPMYSVGRNQMARGEVKFFDCAIASPLPADFGLPLPNGVVGAEPAAYFKGMTEVNCVPQGATSYNRIGTKILIKSIDFRAAFRWYGQTDKEKTQVNVVRYMIVYDQQPNGAFPAITDIISHNIGTAPYFYSGVNMANRSRFTILRDRIVTLDPDASSGVVSVKEFIKTKLETQFKSSTDTIGDITTGAIYFIAFDLYTTSLEHYISMTHATFRIRYFD